MFVLGIPLGCGDDAATPTCIPGRVEACACLGGGSGVQECLPSGTYGACTCPDTDGGIGFDAGDLPDAAPATWSATRDRLRAESIGVFFVHQLGSRSYRDMAASLDEPFDDYVAEYAGDYWDGAMRRLYEQLVRYAGL